MILKKVVLTKRFRKLRLTTNNTEYNGFTIQISHTYICAAGGQPIGFSVRSCSLPPASSFTSLSKSNYE